MTQFVYLIEGEPYVGTVEDYAKALDQASLSGVDVGRTVWALVRPAFHEGAVTPVAYTPKVETSEFDEDDYATVTVSIAFTQPDDLEVATYRVDGRA